MKTSLHIFCLVALVFFLGRCDSAEPERSNTAPSVRSVTASSNRVKAGETTTLWVVATDSDGDQLSYAWSSTSGSFPQGTSGTSVTWKAPDTPGPYQCKVIVSDGQEVVEGTVRINVTDAGLDPPTGLQALGDGELSPGIFNTTIELSWDGVFGISTLKGFNLYRSRDGGPYERINLNVLPANSTSYLDESVQTGEYSYQITSVNIDDLDGSPSTASDPIGALEIALTLIDSGTFEMGDIAGAGSSDEHPVHTVRITQDFYMGTYEVMQAEWRAVMGSNPSYFTGDDRLPVERVSWNDVQDFIGVLNDWAGGSYYRLPTEAEWEYAARAGTTTKYSFGDLESELGNYGWYSSNSGSRTHTVGEKLPNPWGLYDVHGNVYEWVYDWYGSGYYGRSPSWSPVGPSLGSRRVIRGGCWWEDIANDLRSANRELNGPAVRGRFTGFRLSRAAQ